MFGKSQRFLHVVLGTLKKLCICQVLISDEKKEKKKSLKNKCNNNFKKTHL